MTLKKQSALAAASGALVAGLLFSSAASAVEVPEDIHAADYHWMNWHLYRGIDQRGGPYKFDDTYFEIEFGGRSGALDFFGYVDFLDILGDSGNSDKNRGDNFFADIEPRLSIDYLTGMDLSVGPIKEWYLAFDLLMADTGPIGGLQVLWSGIGTDTELPWLGKTGIAVYARYVGENYGAKNEGSWDGYVAHINWFKPFYHNGDDFVAFQGYADYEFASDLGDDDPARSSDSFQSYLGVWYHSKQWAVGYGAKVYRNMTQFEDGAPGFAGPDQDTTGVGHYFNLTYKI
ncbi:Nucleoside-binding outer membrane protein [Hahella chejuensis KCTC 2396]|uniref:Nucleoside-binding outer membrane protein n=1 Tax=Hahella chejuensis (strain KCTC 2396) TaxID=349521 RepID=Q2SQD3_HAHCH|nr:outer membrane protein OmpK [Hahella chejuensis]ABC27141.1 Nucleoside-binding outer membrane protein [Hahella chejuensis KCTC 2396]